MLCKTNPEYIILPLGIRPSVKRHSARKRESTDGVLLEVYPNALQVLRAQLLHKQPQTPAHACLVEMRRHDKKAAFSI